MRTFEEILGDFTTTYRFVQEQEKQRVEIMASEPYQYAQKQIDAFLEGQKNMLASVPDLREELAMDKAELIKYMEENALTEAGEFKAKTRVKRSVDTYAVLQAMGGDIDSLMLVTSVKQKDLETFIKANPEYKKDLRTCIKDEGFTITDLLPV